MIRQHRPWVVILAGGDGRRLNQVRVNGRQLDRPKQFCCFHGSRSLLQETLRRAEGITERSRIVAVVRHDHRQWWLDELGPLPGRNVLAQADNRGTGVAILHALFHILQHDNDPTLVILPSDHAVDNEAVLLKSIHQAAEVARDSHEHLVLLGMTPEHPEIDYGWIVPDDSHPGCVQEVVQFVEKPEAGLAAELFAAGALWNSFISAISGHALLELFEGSQPLMLRHYLESFVVECTDDAKGIALFRALPFVDFSRDVLQAASIRLRVLAVPPCGWTDLGTLPRLAQWLHRRRIESPAANPVLAGSLRIPRDCAVLPVGGASG